MLWLCDHLPCSVKMHLRWKLRPRLSRSLWCTSERRSERRASDLRRSADQPADSRYTSLRCHHSHQSQWASSILRSRSWLTSACNRHQPAAAIGRGAKTRQRQPNAFVRSLGSSPLSCCVTAAAARCCGRLWCGLLPSRCCCTGAIASTAPHCCRRRPPDRRRRRRCRILLPRVSRVQVG